MSAEPIAARIDRGVAWLDENVPDWLGRIDLDRLDLASACECVLGQVFAHKATELVDGFDLVLDDTFTSVPTLGETEADDLGFDLPYDSDARGSERDAAWEALTDAWRTRIAELTSERAV